MTVLSAFRSRCCQKLEDLGDGAMDTKQYDEAISRYSGALNLDPEAPTDLFIKRSKAYVAGGSLEKALHDANEVLPFLLHWLVLVDRPLLGDQPRSIIAAGLREEACSFAQGGRL